MARTFARPDEQIRNSDVYDDTIAAGLTMETGATSIEDDLNNLRSQLKRLSGEVNWHDPLSGNDLLTTSTSVGSLNTKGMLFRTQVLTDITVTAAQNWEVLSVSGSETPTETAAVGAVTTSGAVVAAHGGTFGTHSLAVVAGLNALRPVNLCVVRDAATGQPIQSGGKGIWALLQSEIATDSHTFNDTTQRVQLSFVIENTTGDGLLACPVGDIAGATINYSYVRRLDWSSVPESAFLDGIFVDQAAASASARVTKVFANVIANVNADTDVGGSGGGTNLDVQLPDLSTGAFLADYDVYLNGELLRPGADATANNDYYPGTSLALGQLKFEFKLKANKDVIAVVAYA